MRRNPTDTPSSCTEHCLARTNKPQKATPPSPSNLCPSPHPLRASQPLAQRLPCSPSTPGRVDGGGHVLQTSDDPISPHSLSFGRTSAYSQPTITPATSERFSSPSSHPPPHCRHPQMVDTPCRYRRRSSPAAARVPPHPDRRAPPAERQRLGNRSEGASLPLTTPGFLTPGTEAP